VLEPQGTAFFVILMVVFGGLMVWLVVTKQLVFRILAACLAFVPAMLFGVAAVNKYYDYYQNWGTVASDFIANQGVPSLPKVPQLGNGSKRGIDTALGLTPALRSEAAQVGFVFETSVPAPLLKITRTVYIFLPPQYFQAKYAHYRFPVIELLHGSPGDPEQWIDIVNVVPTMDEALASHAADPAVLIMPDNDGNQKYSLQCLNALGIQDATYLAVNVPDYVSARLQVQPPGRAWAVAGLSEGGYCAANLALQYPNRFGFAGSLSGYFAPLNDQLPASGLPGAPIVYRDPFAGNAALKLRNTPAYYINHIPFGVQIPQFFLAAGRLDAQDVTAAESFRQSLELRQSSVPLDLVPNGGHDATVWRAALRPMFSWMTPQLTLQAQRADAAAAAQQRIAARQKAKAAPPEPAAGVGRVFPTPKTP
jgi:enterochelin esterase-like enzyme